MFWNFMHKNRGEVEKLTIFIQKTEVAIFSLIISTGYFTLKQRFSFTYFKSVMQNDLVHFFYFKR